MARSASPSLPQRQFPAQAHALIGREQDVARACTAVLNPDCRLVTILGTAGVGKTRLAIETAEAVADQFNDGISLVDLTEIADPAALPSFLAMELGIQTVDETVLERVKNSLAEREMLLLLDNFEHILPGALALSEILEACPKVTVLVTSREPLHLRWEQRLMLGPLDVPDLEAVPSSDALLEVPSVALFLQRARAVDLRLEMSEKTLRQVAEVCIRLEGLPLAIELAAARINVFSPASMLERFDTIVRSLQQHAADVPERHGSIRTALEASYRPLSAVEQAAFRRLGVFVGGWTVEAGEAMLPGTSDGAVALEILASLTDKSLINAEPMEKGSTRFRLLDTIRSYALELLTRAGELEAARAEHARYYLGVAEREAIALRAGGPFVFAPRHAAELTEQQASVPWPAVLDHELANLRAALQWADESGESTTLLRLAVALTRYWWTRGLLLEGTHWLELALERNPDAEPALRSRALSGLGIMQRQQGKLDRARALLEEAVALTRTLGDTRLLTTQLTDLGSVLIQQRQFPDGIGLLEEAARLADVEGDKWGTAAARSMVGLADIILTHHADILLTHHEAAEARLVEALPQFQSAGDPRGVVIVTGLLAYLRGLRGDTSSALSLLDDALRLGRPHLPDVTLGSVVEVAASVLSRVATPAACARLLGTSDRLWVRGLHRDPVAHAISDDALTVVSARLDPEELAAALHDGRQLSAQQAIDEARGLIQDAQGVIEAEAAPTPPSARPRTSHRTGTLSAREREVLSLMAEGHSNKEIGEELGISVNTTKFHVSAIMTKLGVSSRAQAVTEAVRRGLV